MCIFTLQLVTMRQTLIIGFLFLVACNPPPNKTDINLPPPYTSYLTDETSFRDIVFSFDAKRDSFVFNNKFKRTTLSTTELQKVEALIITSAVKYNIKKRYTIKEAGKYYKQIIPVINSKGQKEVWVNCLCKVSGDTWKKRVINTNDGGRCYFNLKINLSTNIVSDFSVNGLAKMLNKFSNPTTQSTNKKIPVNLTRI